MSDPPQTIARAVGRRIAAARRAAGLTQAALAQQLRWPRDTLVNYEHGRRPLTLDRLAAIAAMLDLHPAALLIDDMALAQIFTRIVDDREMQQQLRFFINRLDSED